MIKIKELTNYSSVEVEYSENGEYTINPPEGYNGISEATINSWITGIDWSKMGWTCEDVEECLGDCFNYSKDSYEANTTDMGNLLLLFGPYITNYQGTSSNYKYPKYIYVPSIDWNSLNSSKVIAIKADTMKSSTQLNGCEYLRYVSEIDCTTYNPINTSFNSLSFTNNNSLTTIGGFKNLGKAFTFSNYYLSINGSSITKESIMNVINNLAAPDDTSVTGMQLRLSAALYALLSQEDIQIATDKGWSVISA